jgi:hypothetical protein
VTTINRDKIERIRKPLSAGDVEFLSHAVAYCGGFEGQSFKGLLISTMQAGYDQERAARVAAAVKNLTEPEILWLCEHPESDCRD